MTLEKTEWFEATSDVVTQTCARDFEEHKMSVVSSAESIAQLKCESESERLLNVPLGILW